MKLKSFEKYLEKRLTPDEIAQIEQLAKLEIKALMALQKKKTLATKQHYPNL